MKAINTISKKFTLVASVAALMATMFATSCSNDNDYFADYEEQKSTEKKLEEIDTYEYNVAGMWRYEVNGEKYSLYVIKPDYDTGNSFSARFFYKGSIYIGKAVLKNNVMTFETHSDSKMKVSLKATFANHDSQKFTGDMSIDNAAVASAATFNHREDPNNIRYSISYAVVDPDNELPAMGIDKETLDKEVKALNDKTDTGNQRVDTAFGSMMALQAVGIMQLDRLMKRQCAEHPELAKSKVYVESKMVGTFDDVDTDYGTTVRKYKSL